MNNKHIFSDTIKQLPKKEITPVLEPKQNKIVKFIKAPVESEESKPDIHINWYMFLRYQTPYVHDCAIQPSPFLNDFPL